MLLFVTVGPLVTLLKQIKRNTLIVKNGDPTEISAEVTGLPLPKIEWLKDGVVIEQPSETVLIKTEEVQRMKVTTKLSMPATGRMDKGFYTLSASNSHGTAIQNIRVIIYGKTFRKVVLILQFIQKVNRQYNICFTVLL